MIQNSLVNSLMNLVVKLLKTITIFILLYFIFIHNILNTGKIKIYENLLESNLFNYLFLLDLFRYEIQLCK